MREIKTLLDTFTDVSFDLENENAKKVIRKVAEFYKNDYRHQYHEISRYVNSKIEEEDSLGYILNNIKSLIGYLKMNSKDADKILKKIDEKNLSKEIIRVLQKLYDHIALEEERILKNREIIDESKDEIQDEIINRFEEIGDEFKKQTLEVSSSLNANVITIVGLFSAIIFVFFGGVTGMSTIVGGIMELKTKQDLAIPIIMLLIIGLVIFNIIFLLLYSVAKIINKNIGLIIEMPNTKWYYIEEDQRDDKIYFLVINEDGEQEKVFTDNKKAQKYVKRKEANSRRISKTIGLFKRIFFRYPYMVLINIIFIGSIIILYQTI